MSIKPLVAGNWKMNGLKSAQTEFEAMQSQYDSSLQDVVDLMICPPATLLGTLASTSGAVSLGAQDCHINVSGAHTGDLSAEMLVAVSYTHLTLPTTPYV